MLARLSALGTSDELFRHPAHGAPLVTLSTPRDQPLTLRHTPEFLALDLPAGLQLAFPGIEATEVFARISRCMRERIAHTIAHERTTQTLLAAD